ncbi:hypothetical protein CRP01_32495 [Flavilitoribacter nigricans DSM 23189 = NBRC 102662]|uniref:Uncharacterized protein n=2 Tax=Flavilitoribacter TaxID=2762562 RepID=A0A2D0N1X1_FLAN2|nr:hypothetical protein CRP01_32495 [Flavilitoribacter nigricans DSM 23189 = NBRC 102662]
MLLAAKRLEKVNDKLRTEKQRIVELEEKVEQKYRNVERLENLSIHLLFRKVLGDVDEQKEKDRQEYLQAFLQLRDSRRLVKLLEFERGILHGKVEKREVVKNRIESLIKERENAIAARGKSVWLALFQELDDLVRLKSEIEEVKAVGRLCNERAKRILALLEVASARRDWGHRKKISDYSQEKTIVDEAVEEFSSLRVALTKYEEELEDIYPQRETSLSSRTTKFDRFVEVYYNYLINDWIIRDRISSVIAMMAELLAEINHFYEVIERKEQETDELIEKAESKKNALLIEEMRSG